MNSSITSKKALFAWCFYDWACSGFPVIVTTFIFATYFTAKIAVDEVVGTYQWANATALAGIMIAILGPIFGAIADHSGHQKKWLLFFTLICVVSSSFLWFAYPGANYIFYTLACVVMGTIGLEIALVFYNSFLPHIAPKNYLGRISGWSWGLGYLGGIAILSLALFGFVKSPPTWLDEKTAASIRICGPLVAVWFLVFSLPLFLLLKELPHKGQTLKNSVKLGIRELVNTLRSLPAEKNIFLFLIAHLIYCDGLNTLFAFGGIYAAGTFKMTLSQVILFGIALNISAGIGAIALAWVDDYLGSKPTILLSLFFLIFFGALILLVDTQFQFWIFSLCLGLFLGAVQAASRTLMARLTPDEKSAEMFGLYAFSGKITAFIGPWILGLVTLHFHSQRMGLATVLLFFIVGGVLMFWVKEPKKLDHAA